MRNLFANACLLLVSCVAGLALCEASLRLFYPKYRDSADLLLYRDTERIWVRLPHHRSYGIHPDRGLRHSIIHNNIALRQHRDFSDADLTAATNIGFFGDSIVENIRMPVWFSFTEPLDYLLNQRGKRFNVLNFGVHGYEPGQSFLHYRNFRRVKDLDHVFFVYCENDLGELSITKSFHLNEDGHLVQSNATSSSRFHSFINRLHMPYLILDVNGRGSIAARNIASLTANSRKLMDGMTRDQEYMAMHRNFARRTSAHDEPEGGLEIFRQLISRWKRLANDAGSTFSVVLLPNYPQPVIADLLKQQDVEVIDLYDSFGDLDPAHSQRGWLSSPYRFKKDLHWNEAGNRLAAVCLYRVLEEKTGLPYLSEGELEEALFQYYAAFGGEIPPKDEGRYRDISSKTATAIRKKYLALELSTPLENVGERRAGN